MAISYFVLALVFLAAVVAIGSIKIVPQGREFTVQRFGRYTRTLKPGISILTPFMEGIGRRINMMEQVIDIPDLGSGVAFEGHAGICFAHTFPVVDDLDQRLPRVLDEQADIVGP